ncbi:MAG TPA: hypothetical protein VL486_09685 [Verrucomicrobiae bacterium]|nr:hypothetical protein [Verrucomicrobiae bacterium]
MARQQPQRQAHKADTNKPEWVKRIDEAILKASFPATHLKKAKIVEFPFAGSYPKGFPSIMQDPYRHGAHVGHQLCLMRELGDKRIATADSTLQQRRQISEWMFKAIQQHVLPEIVRACICPLVVAKLFFGGFAAGLKRGTFGPTGQISEDISIYLALSNDWEQLMKCQLSTRQASVWLSERLGKTIGPKRVEKIFERFGIKLRPRGRPRK